MKDIKQLSGLVSATGILGLLASAIFAFFAVE
jgi:hypothetical protein